MASSKAAAMSSGSVAASTIAAVNSNHILSSFTYEKAEDKQDMDGKLNLHCVSKKVS